MAENARIAQLVEQRTENPCVGGSNPPPGTISKNHDDNIIRTATRQNLLAYCICALKLTLQSERAAMEPLGLRQIKATSGS